MRQMEIIMNVYHFNDKQGNRDRDCRIAIVYDGVAYSKKEAIEWKMASFVSLGYTKDGKWSNTDWKVSVNTARLVVCMSPFNRWSTDLATCIEHIKRVCKAYIGYTPTDEEARIAFEFLYPEAYSQCMEALTLTNELI